MTQLILLHLRCAWLLMLLGVLSGAVIGLFFHRHNWLGGYAAFPRRMVRLGHIAFFGMGFVQFMFVLTLSLFPVAHEALLPASTAFLIGAIGMPLCCFLTAWRPRLRFTFSIPVLALIFGMGSILFC